MLLSNLHGEVHMSRGINKVSLVLIPGEADGSAGDGDATVPLLVQVVHDSVPIMNLPHPGTIPRVEQHVLSGGGLTRMNMSHDTNIANVARAAMAKPEAALTTKTTHKFLTLSS